VVFKFSPAVGHFVFYFCQLINECVTATVLRAYRFPMSAYWNAADR